MEQMKIVIVDDTVLYLHLGRDILEGKYKVIAINSGELLFKYLEKSSPDLILLDIDMPEMNGFEIIKWLKGTPETEHIPVVFLTARNDLASMQEGMSLGAVGYITKPYKVSVFLEFVDTVLTKNEAGTSYEAKH